MDYPRLSTPIGIGLIAVFMLTLALFNPLWDGRSTGWNLMRVLFTVFGGLLLFIAFWVWLNWMFAQYNARVTEYNHAQSYTERVRVLDMVSRMTPDQLAVIGQGGLGLEWIIAGLEGEAIPYELRTAGGNVPVTFLETFVGDSDDTYLVPIRRYGEGTKEREYAIRLTNTFIGNGWADAARGNLPARWINKPAAEKLLDRMLG